MEQPDFDKCGGLVPVIAQDGASGEVLMLAYMNEEAWNETLRSGEVHYYRPQPQDSVAQGRHLGPRAEGPVHPHGLRSGHGAGASGADRRCGLSHGPQKLFLS